MSIEAELERGIAPNGRLEMSTVFLAKLHDRHVDDSVVRCLICQKPMPEYEPMFCCSGHECACMGLPTNPQICSKRCMSACLDGIGKPMEQRRIDAGIELDTANDGLESRGNRVDSEPLLADSREVT